MIEILAAKKIKIDAVSKKEPFLVCEKREDGGLLIMGLSRYLKIGRRYSKSEKAAVRNNGQRKRGG